MSRAKVAATNIAVLETMLRGIEASAQVVADMGGSQATERLLQLSSEHAALLAAITSLRADLIQPSNSNTEVGRAD